MGKKTVVILIFSHKDELEHYEKISLRQCYRILGKHPIRLVCPKGTKTNCYKEIIPFLEVDFVDPEWMSTYEMYNRLKISPFLYRLYQDYEFILTYELDAFVFRDELEYWCSKEYDYIGSPWFEGHGKAAERSPLAGVGNSGFSLRRVDKCLKSLYSFSYLHDPKDDWDHWLSIGRPIRGALSFFKNSTISNNSFFLFNNFSQNEDLFWGKSIRRNFDWFRVPDESEAWKFGFEINPRVLFEMNDCHLPFGCHAWWKYDIDFWRPHIQSFGHILG